MLEWYRRREMVDEELTPADRIKITFMAATLVAVPQVEEVDALLEGFRRRECASESVQVGTLTCTAIPSLDIVVANGGHGKAQFAVHAQHLIDHSPDAQRLLCVGAAGGLTESLDVGDVVVGTTSVEHDYKVRFVREPLPRHEPDAGLLREFREVGRTHPFPFRLHFAPVASGDEDIVDSQRAQELQAATGAVCAAWEGSGGARAASFGDLAFLEIRCITDRADADAPSSFHENVAGGMSNIADVLVHWSRST